MQPKSSRDAEATLKQLEKSLQTGDFEGALDAVLKEVDSGSPESVGEIAYLRNRCLAAELYDYLGRYEQARNIIEELGRKYERYLSDVRAKRIRGLQTIDERRLMKQRVWVVIHWGHALYRQGSFEDARILLRLCQEVVEERIVSEGFECTGTLARIFYCIGLTHRELYEYAAAKENFTRSIDYAWRGLKDEPDASRDYAGFGVGTRVFTDFSISKCLALGLAWVHFMEGSLHLARPLLLAAKNLLSHYPEQLISLYVDVVHACIERSEHGSEPARLQNAIDILEKAYGVFENHQHAYYKVRAANQLALAYLQKARIQVSGQLKLDAFRQAMSLVGDMKEFQSKDRRFLAAALVIESRIKREQGKFMEAEAFAREALEQGYEHTLDRISALIARGEARMALGNFEGACADFEAALQDGKLNPKVRGICHLHLADLFARKKDKRQSIQHFDEWKVIEGQIKKSSFMAKQEELVTRELDKLRRDFIVSWSDPSLQPEKIERELRGYLADWARARSKNDDEAARRLGISKQTYYNWKAAVNKRQIPA